MGCPEIKKQFVNDSILQGWAAPPEGWSTEYPHGPEKWFRRIHRPYRAVLRKPPRLVNHFKVGADPEFVMTDTLGEYRLDANGLGFRTGLAFGADQNGRLVEVRPKPSRFALEVLASSLVAMRWMAVLYPRTREYCWRAGAYILRDGLGGHVHLGRKAASRTQEILALDKINEILLALGTYPREEVNRRQRGDSFGQRYGLPGDVRQQAYGYEYRTFPSWLDSPWMAYLSLTLAKLSVHDPLLRDVVDVPHTRVATLQQVVRNFLAKYQCLDDDARVAYVALNRLSFPRFVGGDFKGRWGLNYSAEMQPPDMPKIFPSAITPSEENLCEMFTHLTQGSAIAPVVPRPTWNAELPKGYQAIITHTETHHVGGLGELLVDAVGHESEFVHMGPCDGSAPLRISYELAQKMPKDWRDRVSRAAGEALKVVVDPPQGMNCIRINNVWRTAQKMPFMKRVLYCGVFPIWKASEVREGSLEAWKTVPKESGVKSKVLVEE